MPAQQTDDPGRTGSPALSAAGPVRWEHGRMMNVDTMLPGLAEAAGQARRLEELGVDGAFTFEGPHDVFTPLIVAAGATSALELSTNVAIAFPRNPVQLAHQAYDLQLLSQGRFTLGLGSQVRAQVEKRYGASFDRPIARMREMVAALRAIFATWETGERLDFRGEFTSHTLMPPTFNPGPHPFGMPPIAIGGLGPQMVRLAAEVADGLLVMPFNTARHFCDRTLPAIDEGLARAGRSRSELVVSGEVIVCCGRDEDELAVARTAGRWLLSFYASTPSYRPVLEVEGWEDLQPELNKLSKTGRWEEMPQMIDDTMLSTLAAVGSPKEVAAEIVSRFGGQVDRVGFYTPYAVPDATLGELVDELGRVPQGVRS
jgi:probable F420-dependent oxidoreductase